MLANINVISPFSSADHVVTPFNTGGVVLVHRGVWCLLKACDEGVKNPPAEEVGLNLWFCM